MISCGDAELCELNEGSRRLARMGSTLLFERADAAEERAGADERCAAAGFCTALAATFTEAAFLLLTDADFFVADFAGVGFDFFFAAVFTGVMLVLPTICG
jgi:hypothetical protein